MRSLLRLLVILGPLTVTQAAYAQYANRSIGASLGAGRLNADPTLDTMAMLALDGSIYIDSGWEATARIPFAILFDRVVGNAYWGIAGHAGLRYLLNQGVVRPYVGPELTAFYIFSRGLLYGLGANLGVDYFLDEEFSLGARAFAIIYFSGNPIAVSQGYGIQATFGAHF